MDIIFVRHGLPDYSLSDQRRMSQLEKDYAPLDREGIKMIHATASELVEQGAEIIISSPYTRALQTAEIINRQLGLELFVEHDLREWRADLAGNYIDLTERDRRWHEHRETLKQCKIPSDVPYEMWPDLKTRAQAVLNKYQDYGKVIIVSHFNVFESLVGFQPQGIGCGQYKLLDYVPENNPCAQE
ncbi:histidine phosphatase family protein [Vibrio porteresiae]|uniref:Histidine phosphatase family protein n=1 Tax=Vibrio porteresiae DSM 19223 TaxID=1123496 RepID=A0ABZ0QI09_9VIBR|nr:histidine phosphatase family protein [Vibrio porteresiae]WPC75450.1 histidine phosphatase family protein [Vibrio porteresiae DSM 19223]